MRKTNFKGLAKQVLNPKRLGVIVNKIRLRFADKPGRHSQEETIAWIRKNCSDFETLAVELDAKLWEETKEVSLQLQADAEEILSKITVHNLRGGGFYGLLYFLARYTQARCIVETGVAAGYSSQAFLLAIEANGGGHLYSSDFPYFRLENPEQYIGIVVQEHLKKNWDLHIEGDDANLQKIIRKCPDINIFHYDSDKSYIGRTNAMKLIEPRLAKGALIVVDDIQDNSFFYDYVETHTPQFWRVFEFEKKYIGMIGMPRRESV